MAKTNITQYDTTAANNTDIDSVNIAEGCPPSGINNAIRELMAHIADLNAGNVALGTVKVDNLQLDGNAITSTDTNGNITLTPNGNGLVSIAEGDLQIGSTTVTATGAELNLMDGGTSPGTTAVAGSDGIVTNDNSTMRQTTVDTFDTYLSQTTKTLTNKSISGASNTITAVPLTALDIDGGTATTTLADADLLIVDDGAGGTNRKITAANAKTYFGGGSSAPTALGSGTAVDWSSNTKFSKTLGADTTLTFSNISAGSTIELFITNVGKSMDILTMKPATDENISSTASTGGCFGSWFNNDGSRWYVTDNTTNNPIHEFNLSTNYDISTASHSRSSSGSNPNTIRYSGEFNGDGTRLIGYKSDLVEHTLSTAYDISTLSASTNHTVDVDALFQASGGGDSVTGFGGGTIRFNNDGTRLFISQRDVADNEVPRAIVVKLSTAYDIDSTLTVESEWYGTPQNDGLGTTGGKLTTVLSYDGTTIVCAEHNDAAAETGHAVFWHYNLSTPWDLSSARFVGSRKLDLANANATGIENLHITPDGKFMYFTEFQTSNASNTLFQNHDIQGDYKLTLPSVVSTLPATFGDGEDPTTTSYLQLQSLDGTNVLITNHREIN